MVVTCIKVNQAHPQSEPKSHTPARETSLPLLNSVIEDAAQNSRISFTGRRVFMGSHFLSPIPFNPSKVISSYAGQWLVTK